MPTFLESGGWDRILNSALPGLGASVPHLGVMAILEGRYMPELYIYRYRYILHKEKKHHKYVH